MDFLMQEVLRRQLQDIVSIEACVEALATAPLAKALAQEAYGAALGHLDSLQEAIAGEQASASHASV
jgi:4-hydroxy-L-threonine phosphate dehydrogenase PdxA